MPTRFAIRMISGLALMVLLAGSGCSGTTTSSSLGDESEMAVNKEQIIGGAPQWREIAAGAVRTELVFMNPDTFFLTLYRFAPKNYTLRFATLPEPRHVSQWTTELPDAVLIVNGVYFDEANAPVGFFSANGTRSGTTAFDLDKSGVIVTQPSFAILDTSRLPADFFTLPDAAQSYPFFYSDEQQKISHDSGQKARRRTFVGTDTEGFIYIGLATGSISLYALQSALGITGISWDEAINLDGGPSSGLASRFPKKEEIIDSLVAVPNVLYVTAAEPQ